MSSGLDLSLDDLIKQSKSRPKASPASSSGPTRRGRPPARAVPYPPAAPKAAAPPYGVYSEHIAAIAASAPSPPPAAPRAAPRAVKTGMKLHISNLDASVTVEDVQELFSKVGELKHYSVNYDKDGRSKGTAEVVFARKVDALDAIKRYNGVLLDGKPMKIELIGNNAEPPPTAPLMYGHAFPNYNATPNRHLNPNHLPGKATTQLFTVDTQARHGRGRPESLGACLMGARRGESLWRPPWGAFAIRRHLGDALTSMSVYL